MCGDDQQGRTSGVDFPFFLFGQKSASVALQQEVTLPASGASRQQNQLWCLSLGLAFVEFVLEGLEEATGGGDAIDDDRRDCSRLLCRLPCLFGDYLLKVLFGEREQLGVFGAHQAFLQYGVVFQEPLFLGGEDGKICCLCGCGRHGDDGEGKLECLLGPASVLPNAAKRLDERRAQVCLIDDDERVIGEEGGVHRTGIWGESVASEEESGTNLIDSADDDGGLERGASPGFVMPNAAAKFGHLQGTFASQSQECVAHLTQDAVLCGFQRLAKVPGPGEGGIDDDASVYDEDDSPRSLSGIWG